MSKSNRNKAKKYEEASWYVGAIEAHVDMINEINEMERKFDKTHPKEKTECENRIGKFARDLSYLLCYTEDNESWGVRFKGWLVKFVIDIGIMLLFLLVGSLIMKDAFEAVKNMEAAIKFLPNIGAF